jgi:hypothetical protein
LVLHVDPVAQTPVNSSELATPSAALDCLAVALSPLTESDLAMFGTQPPAPHPSIVHAENGWRWMSETLRASWPCDRQAIESQLVRAGIELGEHDIGSSYWVNYGAAHLVRKRAPLRDLMGLVTPQWMAAWQTQAPWLLGFATDVERASTAAMAELAMRPSAETLACVVRCVLVESSLFSKEGSRSCMRDRTAPYVLPAIDLAQPTGAAAERLVAITTLLSALGPQEHTAGLAHWVAQHNNHDTPPAPVPRPNPKPPSDIDTTRLRGASVDEIGQWLSAADPPSLAGLPPNEIFELVARTEHVYRVTAYATAVAYLPESERPRAAQHAVDAYWEVGDCDTQRALLAIAPWMSDADAVDLFCELVGGEWGSTLADRLTGWCGITDLIPLMQRLGGGEALWQVADEIIDVADWLP